MIHFLVGRTNHPNVYRNHLSKLAKITMNHHKIKLSISYGYFLPPSFEGSTKIFYIFIACSFAFQWNVTQHRCNQRVEFSQWDFSKYILHNIGYITIISFASILWLKLCTSNWWHVPVEKGQQWWSLSIFKRGLLQKWLHWWTLQLKFCDF